MIYFEDIAVGQVFETGDYLVEEPEIIAFGRDYDPQPFHTDPAAARASFFGGLVASGWHTAAIMMRLQVDAVINRSAVLPSPGFDDLKWLQPVRPGDRLRVRLVAAEKTPSRSKPEQGSVRFATEVRNQNDDVVMTVSQIGIYRRRDQETGKGDRSNG